MRGENPDVCSWQHRKSIASGMSGRTLDLPTVLRPAAFGCGSSSRGVEKQRLGLDIGMARSGCGSRLRLVRALVPKEDRLGGFQEDIHVEEERHVLDVVEVELKFPASLLYAGSVMVH